VTSEQLAPIHHHGEWLTALGRGYTRIEPDARFRCACSVDAQGTPLDPCSRRATAEDRLCDWCRGGHRAEDLYSDGQ